MAINFRGRIRFLFDGGKGIYTSQLAGRFLKWITREGVATLQNTDNTETTVNIHDSSAAGSSADDHRRISRLEHLTQDLRIRNMDGWADIPPNEADDFGIFILDSDTGIDLSLLPTYMYAVTQTVGAGNGGMKWILVRLRINHPVTGIRVRRTNDSDVEQEVFSGLWSKTANTHGFVSELTQEGYAYYAWSSYPDLDAGDVVTIQRNGQIEHTEYLGDSAELDRHEANPGAHQDSPRRVSHLAIDAPVGRQVYLTRVIRHPGTEHIFSVPVAALANANHASRILIGASRIDLSGQGGPPAATDVSRYPGVFDASRLAAIWQVGYETIIRVAVAASIGTPTALHIDGYGEDFRVALTEESEQIISGVTYKFMIGPGRRRVMNLFLTNADDLKFSLAYGNDYLEGDGSIDAGREVPVGKYESQGSGVWRSIGLTIGRRPGSERHWAAGRMYFPGDVVSNGDQSNSFMYVFDPVDGMPSNTTSRPSTAQGGSQRYVNSWRRF